MTAGLGGANPGNRERKSRGTVCDVATPAGLGHSRLSPSGSGDPCPPGPGPEYLGRIGRSRRWRRGGDPDRPLGAPAPTSAPARTSLPSALDPRVCACAQRTVPPRRRPDLPVLPAAVSLQRSQTRVPPAFQAAAEVKRQQRSFIRGGGRGSGAGRPSEAPEEELGASVQCAHFGARLAGQPLAQGGPILVGEASAAQLQLLQKRGRLVPEAQAQGALDATTCRGEAGAGLRELLPAWQSRGSPAGACGIGGRPQGTPKRQLFLIVNVALG